MENIIQNLKVKNPSLKHSEIEGVLYILLHEKILSNSELIQKTGIPKETLKQFKMSFSQFLSDPRGDDINLTEEGRAQLESMGLLEYKWSLLEYKDLDLVTKLGVIREKYGLLPKREYDQFFATLETSVEKAKVMHSRGVVSGKSIALLGDDDLISVTLGLIDSSFKEIVVFDIDPEILRTIENICKDLSISNVRTEFYDARKPLKENFKNKFDVVVTDPPYTKSGVSLFLNRAVRLSKHATDDFTPYIFLYYGNSYKEPEKVLKVQEILQRYNLVVEDKINKFARYFGAESIGSASSLYILAQNKHTEALDEYLSTEIYTFERTADESFPFVDHYVFKLFKVPQPVVSSKTTLLKALGQFCNYHRLNVVDSKITKFKGGGMTFTFVLANSNLVVHTWPEKQALHIDLITCMPIVKKEFFGRNLSDLFKTNYIDITKVE